MVNLIDHENQNYLRASRSFAKEKLLRTWIIVEDGVARQLPL